MPGWDQLAYDRRAFALKVSVDQGAPTRVTLFKRISDRLLPGHFEWHAWTDRVVQTMCEYPLAGFPGCSNCVDGSTRILDPITGEQPTIQELCETRSAPTVMTLDGPAQAEVPYVKGIDELFEVKLVNGTSFKATGKHRVLVWSANASHWCHVADLQTGEYLYAYAPNLPASTSARGLLDQGLGDPGYTQTVADSQEHCCPFSRHCDEPLRVDANSGQSFSPSPAGVREHNQDDFCADDLATRYTHNHVSSRRGHLSSEDGFGQSGFLDILASHQPRREIAERAGRSSSRRAQWHIAKNLPAPYAKPIHDFAGSELHADVSHLLDKPFSCCFTVAPTAIQSIRSIGVRKFYDISVPGPEHYFAEGTIHHNSAKTFNIVSFGVVWWLANPHESSVTLVSTSKQSLRRRGWAEVTRCHTSIPGPRVGNFIDSRMLWQAVKGDDKHAVIGKAVEEGPTQKVADDIKGVHTRRQMVIIDEATSVPEAIWEACTNLYTYPEEFVLVCIGNPLNRLDQFGRFCEPERGWNTVNEETEEWDAAPQDKYSGLRPRIIKFDAEKSPNIVEGRTVSRHLPTKEKVEAARKASGGQTPSYWQNIRGHWPPEGLTKTVFTYSALEKNDGYGRHTFTGRNFTIIGAFDPAFGGGDRPALRFAKLGEITGDKWGIESFPPVIIPIDAKSSNPVHFQLAEQVRRQCESFKVGDTEYSCSPENFATDATGEGGGLADILQRTWSPRILRVEFGGRASEDAASFEDSRLACDIYENKRTEMHFRTRDALNAGQLKGIDRETAKELCFCEFDDSKKRIKLMAKADYKEKFAHSPDFADCLVMLTEVARRRGFVQAAVGTTVNRAAEWDQQVKDSHAVYEDTYKEEEFEDEAEAFV